MDQRRVVHLPWPPRLPTINSTAKPHRRTHCWKTVTWTKFQLTWDHFPSPVDLIFSSSYLHSLWGSSENNLLDLRLSHLEQFSSVPLKNRCSPVHLARNIIHGYLSSWDKPWLICVEFTQTSRGLNLQQTGFSFYYVLVKDKPLWLQSGCNIGNSFYESFWNLWM